MDYGINELHVSFIGHQPREFSAHRDDIDYYDKGSVQHIDDYLDTATPKFWDPRN
jgi:hypothetical protein